MIYSPRATSPRHFLPHILCATRSSDLVRYHAWGLVQRRRGARGRLAYRLSST